MPHPAAVAPADASAAVPVIEARGLTKRFGRREALRDVSVTAGRGELVAVIGPNGAGKTTLIHQISGMLGSDSGQILFDGADITRLGMHERVRRGLARSFQVTSILPGFSALEHVVGLVAEAGEGGIDLAERRARGVEEDLAREVHDAEPSADDLDHGDPPARVALRIVGRADDALLAVEEGVDLGVVVGVVAERDGVDAHVEDRAGHLLGDADAPRRVLAVDHHDVEGVALA